MNKKLTVTVLVFLLVFSITGVLAQNQVKFNYANEVQKQEMEQRQNRFQNRYNFTCEGECDYKNINNETARLEIKLQKRFLFWNVNSIETYDLNDNGEIIQARHNIWSRILNRNKLR